MTAPVTIAAARRWRLALVYGVAVAGSLFAVVPVLWMLSTALKADDVVFSVPPQLLPRDPAWSNFRTATELIPFWRYLRNSLFVAGVGAVGTVLSSALAAYALARMRVAGAKVVLALVLATVMLPQ
jgi:ABC-type glycerol-3-phosphate transport system permease component